MHHQKTMERLMRVRQASIAFLFFFICTKPKNPSGLNNNNKQNMINYNQAPETKVKIFEK
jgi:hypothetical protein